jgi:class 3 adenylate cyclase/tetratricopeptide (TPR) repeat protein
VRCQGCEHPNPADASFCAGCGQPLARVCASCARPNDADARYCNGCGDPLPGDATPPRASEERAPRDYTPKHLADKILQSKSALEGERKQVTVLFADVKGSMELAEQVGAEQWHRILDRFFQILADGIHRFEGTVNQYTGDGIMALFGAPIAHEDHAQRACWAALHLRDELRRYAREVKREHGLTLLTRVGIHSGDVVVGKIGDDLRMDYTAQGHTVGLAARMEGLASPDTVYLSAATARLVEGFFELEDLGAFRVKGVSDPVGVFELEGPGPHQTRFDAARARGLSRFVGRDGDMQALEAALAQARAGNGQVVGVVAEAGAGKSRLCYEFAKRCRGQGIEVTEGRGVAHGGNVPLLPILQAFRQFYGIGERDGERSVREKIAGRMVLLDERFREALPLLFEFFGAPDPDRPAPRMDPEARQRQLFAILRRVTQLSPDQAEGGVGVVLIEDLHWIDPASEAFLAEWVGATAGTRNLLLVNFRPEYRADWMQKSYYRQLPLAPLGPEAIRELLDDLLGSDSSISGLADEIHERTRGNPLFSEEVVRSLIEAGNLEGTRGAYRLVTPVDELAIPASVHAVLAARIDRLAEREKQVLQTAAVIGKEFSEPVLAEVAELPGADLAAALAALEGAEFIFQQALYPVAEYAFKHPLTQEVALESQLQSRRRRIHSVVARALEEAYPQQLDEQAAVIAHHLEQAGEELGAARWHRRAAEWIGRSDVAQAIRHWQRVLVLTAELPEGEERTGLRLGACTTVLIQGGWRLGLSGEQTEALFVEGRALAARAGDNDARLILINGYAARVGLAGGDVRRYDALAREAHPLVDESTSPAVHGLTLLGRAYSSFLLGQIDEALRLAAEMPEVLAGDLQLGLDLVGFSLLAWSWQNRAEQLACRGRLDDARACQREAERLAHAGDVGEVLVWVRLNEVVIGSTAGERDERVLEELRRGAFEALELAEQIGSSFSRVLSHMRLGAARALHGEWEDAVRACETALQISSEHQTCLEWESEILYQLAEARLGAGDLPAAQTAAEEGIRLARERGQLYFEALNHLARARVLRRARGADARDEIEQTLDRALVLVEETNGRSIEPQLLEERARLSNLLGDDAACEHGLRDAQRLYAEIGAGGHAERLAEELGP